MNIIVAADKNWGIGRNMELLVRFSEDRKNFRRMTEGNVVVGGRKTLESFPGGQPLKDRVNIVLSSRPDYQVKGAVVVHSQEELMEELGRYPDKEIYVIGGEGVYRSLLPLCTVAHVTKVDHAYEADTFFPNLDELPDWELTGESDEQTYFDLEYRFLRYERRG